MKVKKWDRSLGTSKREQGIVTPKNPKTQKSSNRQEDIRKRDQLRAESRAEKRNAKERRLIEFEKNNGYRPFSIKRDFIGGISQ